VIAAPSEIRGTRTPRFIEILEIDDELEARAAALSCTQTARTYAQRRIFLAQRVARPSSAEAWSSSVRTGTRALAWSMSCTTASFIQSQRRNVPWSQDPDSVFVVVEQRMR